MEKKETFLRIATKKNFIHFFQTLWTTWKLSVPLWTFVTWLFSVVDRFDLSSDVVAVDICEKAEFMLLLEIFFICNFLCSFDSKLESARRASQRKSKKKIKRCTCQTCQTTCQNRQKKYLQVLLNSYYVSRTLPS